MKMEMLRKLTAPDDDSTVHDYSPGVLLALVAFFCSQQLLEDEVKRESLLSISIGQCLQPLLLMIMHPRDNFTRTDPEAYCFTRTPDKHWSATLITL
jgi:hypothetical protein